MIKWTCEVWRDVDLLTINSVSNLLNFGDGFLQSGFPFTNLVYLREH